MIAPVRTIIPLRMDEDARSWFGAGMAAGLCDYCVFQKIQEIRTGETVSECEQSEIDGRFPKYPRLPVYNCIGYEARAPEIAEEPLPAERR